MPTLLLTPRYTEDSRALRAAATAADWDCVRLANWRIPDWVAERELVFYGEPLLAEVIAEHELPFVLLEPSLDWLPTLPKHYARRAVRRTTLVAARRQRAQAFIKPADLKSFAARVYTSGTELPSSGNLPNDLPVLVQTPVRWELEVRCFVLERRVVTLSPYLRDGRLAQADDGSWPAEEAELAAARAFAGVVLADPAVRLPAAVVLDVGIVAGHGWAVIEANAAWGAGLYGCEPDAVLPVLQRATVRRDALADEDRPWVRC
jgi:hypothetical protein